MPLQKCARLLTISFFVALAFMASSSADEHPQASTMQLKQAWSHAGHSSGVAVDQKTGVIYMRGLGRQCIELDAAGTTQREIKLPPNAGSILRFARLTPDSPGELLAFDVWSSALNAFDLQGNLLWNYGRGQGIDDVWPVDLTGDGIDEVIVGYNGVTGLHTLDGKGQPLWKSNAIGNVWHVCGGDVVGDGNREVVTTSAKGDVHIWSNTGRKLRDLDAGCYASMVRVGKIAADDGTDTIFAAGSQTGWARGEVLVALGGDGSKKWKTKLPGAAVHTDSAQLAPNKPWIAVGMRGGTVHVIDIGTGQVLASVKGQGTRPEVNWASTRDSASTILLIASENGLNAFTVSIESS